MVRSVRLAAVALLAVLALAGCGGSGTPDEDPGTFAVTLLRQLDRGESGSAWDELHPLHQEAVTRDRYVRCEQTDPISGDVTSIDVVRVTKEPATVPGKDGEESSTAVELRYRLKLPGSTARSNDLVVHLFPVDGRWAWVIGPSDYAAYAAGRCPPAG
jgi:hypothetical protein